MIDNALARLQAHRALEDHEFIELAERVTEEHFCILEPENVEHFRAECGRLYNEMRTATEAYEAAKRELAKLKARMEAAPGLHSDLANKLLMSPPQGVFPFTGRLVFLRTYGATIQLDDEGNPIAETWRKATDAERAWVSKQDEVTALEAEAARQTSIFDAIQPAEEAPAEEPGEVPATTLEEMPF